MWLALALCILISLIYNHTLFWVHSYISSNSLSFIVVPYKAYTIFGCLWIAVVCYMLYFRDWAIKISIGMVFWPTLFVLLWNGPKGPSCIIDNVDGGIIYKGDFTERTLSRWQENRSSLSPPWLPVLAATSEKTTWVPPGRKPLGSASTKVEERQWEYIEGPWNWRLFYLFCPILDRYKN
jgi:hypothetical protein